MSFVLFYLSVRQSTGPIPSNPLCPMITLSSPMFAIPVAIVATILLSLNSSVMSESRFQTASCWLIWIRTFNRCLLSMLEHWYLIGRTGGWLFHDPGWWLIFQCPFGPPYLQPITALKELLVNCPREREWEWAVSQKGCVLVEFFVSVDVHACLAQWNQDHLTR